jgi:hypothetical protein
VTSLYAAQATPIGKGHQLSVSGSVFSLIAWLRLRAGYAWELLIDVMKETAKRSVWA